MRKKVNDIPDKFEAIKKHLEKTFPFKNFKVGGYMGKDTLYKIGYVKNPRFNAVSGTVEMNGDDVILRLYRPGKEGPTFKIDMYAGVNKKTQKVLLTKEFEHYIYTDIPNDIMKRTNLSIKLKADKDGNLVPDSKPDGTVEAFINIEPPDWINK